MYKRGVYNSKTARWERGAGNWFISAALIPRPALSIPSRADLRLLQRPQDFA